MQARDCQPHPLHWRVMEVLHYFYGQLHSSAVNPVPLYPPTPVSLLHFHLAQLKILPTHSSAPRSNSALGSHEPQHSACPALLGFHPADSAWLRNSALNRPVKDLFMQQKYPHVPSAPFRNFFLRVECHNFKSTDFRATFSALT